MPTPLEALQALQMGASPGRRQQLPTEAYGFSGATPTQGELSSPFEQEQAAIAAKANAADRARVDAIRKADLEGIMAGFGGSTQINQSPSGTQFDATSQGSPAQRQATSGRAIDFAKSQIPITQANISGQTQRDVAGIQGKNAIRTKQEEEAGTTRRSHDMLKQLLGVQLGEGDSMQLPGGGQLKHGSSTFPTGPAGVNLEKQIQDRMKMETPVSGIGSIQNFFSPGSGDYTPEEKAAAERALDATFPSWRSRMDPGFKFAVPNGPGAASVPPPPGPASTSLSPAAPGTNLASPGPNVPPPETESLKPGEVFQTLDGALWGRHKNGQIIKLQ